MDLKMMMDWSWHKKSALSNSEHSLSTLPDKQRSSNNKRLERKSVHNVVDDVADNNVEPGYIQQQCVFRLLVMVSNNINILFPSFCYSALHSTLPPSSCVQLHIGLSQFLTRLYQRTSYMHKTSIQSIYVEMRKVFVKK